MQKYILKSKLMKVILIYITLYFVQFIAIPLSFGNIMSTGNEANFILIISCLLSSSIIVLFVTTTIYFWVIGLLFYDLLVCLYNAEGYYGIGVYGLFESASFSFENLIFDLLWINIGYLIIQLIILFFVSIVKKHMRSKK
ncbi:MAG: hypothetical protein ACRDA4_09225 [Filifactoraceae bacterium]